MTTCSHCGAVDPYLVGSICGACWYGRMGHGDPTEDDLCAAADHAYYGDEGDPAEVPPEIVPTLGRCYCGAKRYPAGGPRPVTSTPPAPDDTPTP